MAHTVAIIPCYNEADRLRVDRFVRFAREQPGVTLLFVNDGSTDRTRLVLERLRAGAPSVQILELPRNAGKAEAVRQGVQAALVQAPDYVAYWDADLATPLEAIPSLRDVLVAHPKKVLVMGSRVALLGRRVRRSFRRHILGRVFATLASCLLRLPVYDTQCGAKLFRADARLGEVFAEPFLSRWVFDVEILARLGRIHGDLHELVYEYPLEVWEDVKGSKLRAKDFAVAAADLLRIWRAYRPGAAPAPTIPLPAGEDRRRAA